MADIIKFMPELEGRELVTVGAIIREMTDEQAMYSDQVTEVDVNLREPLIYYSCYHFSDSQV